MTFELNIETNDGWVVTLISDKPIDLGDAVLRSIIVQPTGDHDRRVAESGDVDDAGATVHRIKYQLRGVAQS